LPEIFMIMLSSSIEPENTGFEGHGTFNAPQIAHASSHVILTWSDS